MTRAIAVLDEKNRERQDNLLRKSLRGLAAFWEQFTCFMHNIRRTILRGHDADYAVIRLDHEISERSPDVPWFYAYLPSYRPPLSLEYLGDALKRIAQDPDLRGVVFLLKGPAISLSQAQSLAALFARFRQWDQEYNQLGISTKEIVVHLEQVSAATYVVAAAAHRITMTPLSTWDVMGLRIAPTYWRELLDRLGVEFDVVKIAPWKTAADGYIRSEMSEAEREQFNWLLDSLAEDITNAAASGRGLSTEQVRALIDQAPLTADQALTAGLIDHIAYEDELPTILKVSGDTKHEYARFQTFAQVRDLLYRYTRPITSGRVGILSVSGTMIVGRSRSFPLPLPLVGDDMMGSETVIEQIRSARKDSRLQAVVLHIDSGGGSALASDLIWRELKLLDQEKPLIVYMGNTAASGGYYIATPGRKIIAQSATLTGSIGVVIAKPVTKEARAKIGANREILRRGDNAGLFTDDDKWTDAQRIKVTEQLMSVYDTFKQRVAEGRNLPFESIDDIANGRVWTGKQALAHGLIDEIGDLEIALRAAYRAANLPEDGSVRLHQITSPGERLLGEPVETLRSAWQQTNGKGVGVWAKALVQGQWASFLARDPIWLIDFNLPRVD